MIAVLMYLIEVLRRALRRSSRGIKMLAETFREALVMHSDAGRKYPFAE
jgi:hypothetical protein